MAEENAGKVVVTKDGPYLVTGSLPMAVHVIETLEDNSSWEWREGQSFEVSATYALCRCGKSGKAPFCDGTHAATHFDGTETADRRPYDEQKTVIEGPTMLMDDVRPLCAEARFCDAVKDSWDSIPDSADEEARSRLKHQVTRCPSGRLVLWDKTTGKPIEANLKPSIGVVEDPGMKCSGPLWVRGGIQIEAADGANYEKRNRVTLCRCGESKNKPYCDSSHVEAAYQDGIK